MKTLQNLESRDPVLRASRGSTGLLITVVVLLAALTAAAPKKADAAPGRSTTIALTSDETRVVVVNRDANSLSIIRVKNKNGNDVSNKIAEIPVGEEPRCVAVSPDDRFAFVTNAISATVSVVNLAQNRVVKEIKVGTEPRGCALTANGSLLYALTIPKGLCPSSIRPHGQSPEPCKSAADPSPLQSPIRAPATSLTTRSSSPRSSPNSTRISLIPTSTAMVRGAISENRESFTPFPPATPIHQSPKSR